MRDVVRHERLSPRPVAPRSRRDGSGRGAHPRAARAELAAPWGGERRRPHGLARRGGGNRRLEGRVAPLPAVNLSGCGLRATTELHLPAASPCRVTATASSASDGRRSVARRERRRLHRYDALGGPARVSMAYSPRWLDERRSSPPSPPARLCTSGSPASITPPEHVTYNQPGSFLPSRGGSFLASAQALCALKSLCAGRTLSSWCSPTVH